MRSASYEDFDTTELFCPKCRKAVPVRKRLLIILAEGDKYDYTCVYCGSSVGDKLVKTNESLVFSIEKTPDL